MLKMHSLANKNNKCINNRNNLFVVHDLWRFFEFISNLLGGMDLSQLLSKSVHGIEAVPFTPLIPTVEKPTESPETFEIKEKFQISEDLPKVFGSIADAQKYLSEIKNKVTIHGKLRTWNRTSELTCKNCEFRISYNIRNDGEAHLSKKSIIFHRSADCIPTEELPQTNKQLAYAIYPSFEDHYPTPDEIRRVLAKYSENKQLSFKVSEKQVIEHIRIIRNGKDRAEMAKVIAKCKEMAESGYFELEISSKKLKNIEVFEYVYLKPKIQSQLYKHFSSPIILDTTFSSDIIKFGMSGVIDIDRRFQLTGVVLHPSENNTIYQPIVKDILPVAKQSKSITFLADGHKAIQSSVEWLSQSLKDEGIDTIIDIARCFYHVFQKDKLTEDEKNELLGLCRGEIIFDPAHTKLSASVKAKFIEHKDMLIPQPYRRRRGFIASSIIECFNGKVKSKGSDIISILGQIQKVAFANLQALISNYKNYSSDMDLGVLGLKLFSQISVAAYIPAKEDKKNHLIKGNSCSCNTLQDTGFPCKYLLSHWAQKKRNPMLFIGKEWTLSNLKDFLASIKGVANTAGIDFNKAAAIQPKAPIESEELPKFQGMSKRDAFNAASIAWNGLPSFREKITDVICNDLNPLICYFDSNPVTKRGRKTTKRKTGDSKPSKRFSKIISKFEENPSIDELLEAAEHYNEHYSGGMNLELDRKSINSQISNSWDVIGPNFLRSCVEIGMKLKQINHE